MKISIMCIHNSFQVKDLMFGKELLPGWEDAIDDFKREI